MRVLGGVLVPGGIAASDVAAGQAEAQVDPCVPDGQALLAAFWGAGGDVLNLIEMGAWGTHAIAPRSGEYQEDLLLITVHS
jgi:hypothetical protein